VINLHHLLTWKITRVTHTALQRTTVRLGLPRSACPCTAMCLRKKGSLIATCPKHYRMFPRLQRR